MTRIIAFVFALLFSSSAWAASTSYQGTLGSGAGFAAWCVGGSGASCSGGAFWPSTVIANSSGAELFTSGNAGYVQFPSAQAVTATLGAETTKVIGTVNQGTSPWVISGAVTGTFWQATQPVSGTFYQTTQPVSIASGGIVSGADVTEGTTADTTAYSGTGGCTTVACLKGIYSIVNSAVTAIEAPLAAGYNIIGGVSFNTGNAPVQPHICGSHYFAHITTNTDTELVPISGSTAVYICDIEFSFTGVGALYLESHTTASCGGTLAQIDMAWTALASTPYSKAAGNSFYRGLGVGAGKGLCAHTTSLSSTDVDISVYYDQY